MIQQIPIKYRYILFIKFEKQTGEPLRGSSTEVMQYKTFAEAKKDYNEFSQYPETFRIMVWDIVKWAAVLREHKPRHWLNMGAFRDQELRDDMNPAHYEVELIK